MKQLWKGIAAIAFILNFGACWSSAIEDEYGTVGAEEQIAPQALRPLKFNGSANIVGGAEIHKRHFRGQKLHYALASVDADYAFYYNRRYEEGAILSAIWSHVHIGWHDNPFFRQENFDTASLVLDAFSGRCANWFWMVRAGINVSTETWDFSHYATYDFLLWGRYSFVDRETLAFHIGFLAQTGMKVDRVYPIVGIDWRATENVKVNLVFPVNLSALYTFSHYWTVGAAGRFFNTRNRVDSGDRPPFLPQAIVEYRTGGLEALVNFDNKDWLYANVHAGYSMGGKMKISNRHHRHGRWFKLGCAPYVGGELAIKF